MDIADAVSTDTTEFAPTTPASKLMGAFRQTRARAFPVVDDGEVVGVVTRKVLLASQRSPDQHADSVMREDVPRVGRHDDVREVARLVVESGLDLLPVYEGEAFAGVVTVDSLLELVRPNLDAVTVDDAATYDLISVDPDTTLGEVIHRLREHHVSRVPVIEDGDPVGMISVYDLVEFVTRAVEREQGGDVSGSGPGQSGGQFPTHGGWGERAGEQARLLDLPARDVMSTPVRTVDPDRPLGEAVAEMLEDDLSSLLVVGDAATPLGILTTTDAVRALTWEPDDAYDVQIFGIDLLEDLGREAVAERLREIDEKHAAMDVLEANVVFHEHRESQRGVPLIQCTTRLFTSDGRYSGTGEGYGAAQAFREAAEILERNVLDEKGRNREKHKSRESREQVEKLLGWWIEG